MHGALWVLLALRFRRVLVAFGIVAMVAALLDATQPIGGFLVLPLAIAAWWRRGATAHDVGSETRPRQPRLQPEDFQDRCP